MRIKEGNEWKAAFSISEGVMECFGPNILFFLLSIFLLILFLFFLE